MTRLPIVTHSIVSQVNPHVHLFFFAPRGSAGKPVAHRKGKGEILSINLSRVSWAEFTSRLEGQFLTLRCGAVVEVGIDKEFQGIYCYDTFSRSVTILTSYSLFAISIYFPNCLVKIGRVCSCSVSMELSRKLTLILREVLI